MTNTIKLSLFLCLISFFSSHVQVFWTTQQVCIFNCRFELYKFVFFHETNRESENSYLIVSTFSGMSPSQAVWHHNLKLGILPFSGMSPSQAVWHHNLKLGILNDLTITVKRSTNPDLNAVQYLQREWLKGNNNETEGPSVLDAVRKYTSRHQNHRINCTEFEGGYCVVLVTEFMLRIHQYHQASKEVVFVDSMPHIYKQNCCLTTMVCPSKAGTLPLAVLLTSGLSKQELTAAFKLLQETLGKESFFQQGYPCAFITDNSDTKHEALAAVWPHSKLFLSVYHILREVWRWLSNTGNRIKLCDRKPLLNIMKQLVCASSKENFEMKLEAMQGNTMILQYGNFIR